MFNSVFVLLVLANPPLAVRLLPSFSESLSPATASPIHLPGCAPHRQIVLRSWNLETLRGRGKFELPAPTLNSLPLGIVCLQKTKRTSTDHIQALNWHFYLYGDPTGLHAGVGFAVPQLLHPLVHDFIPLSSRIAVLQLSTKPLPTMLFSVYAPSQVADDQEGARRKNVFWRSLEEWFIQFSPHSYPILMGDFNTRLYINQGMVPGQS